MTTEEMIKELVDCITTTKSSTYEQAYKAGVEMRKMVDGFIAAGFERKEAIGMVLRMAGF